MIDIHMCTRRMWMVYVLQHIIYRQYMSKSMMPDDDDDT